MSPDEALVIFTSLDFASVSLALLVGVSGQAPAELLTTLASMTPEARRHAQYEQLNYMTALADEAINARELGKRAPFPQDMRQISRTRTLAQDLESFSFMSAIVASKLPCIFPPDTTISNS